MSFLSVELLFILVCGAAGAFGGIVAGIVSASSNKIVLPFSGRRVEIGFVGDGLIGMAGSLAIYLVVEPAFAETLKPENARSWLVAVALGVLSGFAGERLLRGMSSRLVEKVAGLDNRIDTVERRERALALNLRADELLHQGRLQEAEGEVEQVLELDPDNILALISRGKIFRRREKWTEAIGALTRIIERHPGTERAYYNRACYKLLSGAGRESALADLRRAVQLQPLYIDYASKDADFKSLWEDDVFKAVLATNA